MLAVLLRTKYDGIYNCEVEAWDRYKKEGETIILNPYISKIEKPHLKVIR